MSSHPIISVIVQTYRHRKFVAETVQSLLQQDTNHEYEILVVDDASDDGTWEIIRQIEGHRASAIKIEVNSGAAHAFNVAFGSSRGKFIARIDGDDRLRPSFLSETMTALLTNEDACLAYGNISVISEDGDVLEERPKWVRPLPIERELQLLELIGHYCVPAPTILFRRSVLQQLMPIPDWYRNFIDWGLAVKLSRFGRFHYVDQILADYRLHSQNESRQRLKDTLKERIVFHVLEDIFSILPRSGWSNVHRQRPTIYSDAYLNFASAYISSGKKLHAIRCLLSSGRSSPRTLLTRKNIRRMGSVVKHALV